MLLSLAHTWGCSELFSGHSNDFPHFLDKQLFLLYWVKAKIMQPNILSQFVKKSFLQGVWCML